LLSPICSPHRCCHRTLPPPLNAPPSVTIERRLHRPPLPPLPPPPLPPPPALSTASLSYIYKERGSTTTTSEPKAAPS
jgi:hypothetical protein